MEHSLLKLGELEIWLKSVAYKIELAKEKKELEAERGENKEKQNIFFDKALSAEINGEMHYSLGYLDKSRGSVMSLEKAIKTAQEVRGKLNIEPVVVEIVVGNWGQPIRLDEHTNFTVMTHKQIPINVLEINKIRFNDGGTVKSFNYQIGGL